MFLIDLLKFHIIHRNRPAIDQLIQGLETAGIYNILKQYSRDMESIFCYSATKLTAETMKLLFKPNFSEVGSNKRAIENRVIVYFLDYLLDCEGIFEYLYYHNPVRFLPQSRGRYLL